MTNPKLLPASFSGDGFAWDQALYAFLVEKGNRSGSRRTVEGYSRMLWPFFAGRTPDRVTPATVLAYAHGIGASGRTPPSPRPRSESPLAAGPFYALPARPLRVRRAIPVRRPAPPERRAGRSVQHRVQHP